MTNLNFVTEEEALVFYAVAAGIERVPDIANALGKKRTAISNLINKLFRQGLVKKDKRGVRVYYSVNWNGFKDMIIEYLVDYPSLHKPLEKKEIERLIEKLEDWLRNYVKNIAESLIYLIKIKREKKIDYPENYFLYYFLDHANILQLTNLVERFFIIVWLASETKVRFRKRVINRLGKRDLKLLEKIVLSFLSFTVFEEIEEVYDLLEK